MSLPVARRDISRPVYPPLVDRPVRNRPTEWLTRNAARETGRRFRFYRKFPPQLGAAPRLGEPRRGASALRWLARHPEPPAANAPNPTSSAAPARADDGVSSTQARLF